MRGTKDASSPTRPPNGPDHSLPHVGSVTVHPTANLTGSDTSRVVILGDIGGQFEAFETTIRELGIDPGNPVLPDGMTLIQVGDILRVGGAHPELDNDGCVALADSLIRVNPGRYIQLIGNHEAAAIGGHGNRVWTVKPDLDLIVSDWWTQGHMQVAAVIRTGGRDVLITHAGLTVGMWHSLNRPDALGAAEVLNAYCSRHINDLLTPGRLLTGVPSLSADPLNALAADELLPGWLAVGSPGFDQIHGHSTVYEWNADDWYGNPLQEIRQNTVLDPATRRHCTLIGASLTGSEATITGVDWKFGSVKDTRTWPLLTFEDARVIT